MNRITSISIAVACALGVSATVAQTVLRGDATVSNAGKATQTVAQASTTAPIQTAQAGTSGGVGTPGSVGSTVLFVGAAVAGVAAASSGGSTVNH